MSKLIVMIEATPNVGPEGQLLPGHSAQINVFYVTDAGERLAGQATLTEVLAVLDSAKRGLLAQVRISPPSIVLQDAGPLAPN